MHVTNEVRGLLALRGLHAPQMQVSHVHDTCGEGVCKHLKAWPQTEQLLEDWLVEGGGQGLLQQLQGGRVWHSRGCLVYLQNA